MLYTHNMKFAVISTFQHRFVNLMYVLSWTVEPIVYLAVWSSVAESRGGVVGGYSIRELSAYYIVLTLVRITNTVFTPYGFEGRIRTGRFSSRLVRPLHPIHYDLSYFAGDRLFSIVMWIPVATFLYLVFRPALSPTLLEAAVFLVATWGAYLVRSMFLWALGLVSFWTTRAAAVFELYMMVELLLSGRLLPLVLLPSWAQVLAEFLPFKWIFEFPIVALIGRLSTGEMLYGLAMQALWTFAGAGLVALVWRSAVRHYTAVGD